MTRLVALVAVVMLSGCAAAEDTPAGQQPTAGRWSLRQALADAIAPPGYQPNGGPAVSPEAAAQDHAIQGAYQADIARQQAGAQSVMVSQVTIYGGRINVPSGIGLGSADWRDHSGVATVTVAECESAPIRLQRADKSGGTTVYATRVNGIVYVGPFGSGARCEIPTRAVSYPNGEFPLTIQHHVQGATVRIDTWGASTPAFYPIRRN